MFNILDIGASGLKAQRVRLDTIAQNIANVDTVANLQRKNIPYQRRFVVFKPDAATGGVNVSSIEKDASEFQRVYEPGNTELADREGYVLHPNVDLSVEFVNALDASRAYDANITMMETTKSMFNASLRLLG
jgi:flagellar basal-body rod protein FlgC